MRESTCHTFYLLPLTHHSLNEIIDTVYDSVVTLVEDIDSLYKYRTAASETIFIS